MVKRKNDHHAYESDQLSAVVFNNIHVFQQLTEPTLQEVVIDIRHKSADPTEYILNSNNFRGPDHGPTDLLIAGCSQTFGIGVSEEVTWGAKLSKMLGLSYANIALPGASPQTIVESIFSYIKEHGAPRAVCINFPSVYRFKIPTRADIATYPYGHLNETLFESEQTTAPSTNSVIIRDMNMAPTGTSLDDVVNWQTYSKRPYDITKVLSYESALYLTMMSINYLIEYCKSANIHLVFTTWYPDADKFLSEKKRRTLSAEHKARNKMDMSGYTPLNDIETCIWYPEELGDCHLNEENLPFWDYGLDKPGHMGAHAHLHFAELFYRKLVEIL